MSTPLPSRSSLPSRAEVVVIGGGVMGTSIAFHLAEAGVRDVVLLERDSLGSGSTSKAAGGVRANFSDRLNIALGARSLDLFHQFAERPGQEIDLRTPGYLFLLSQPDDVALFEASTTLQNEADLPTRMISPAEAQRLSPLISTDGLLAACFSPSDGHCTPESVVLGYAAAARRLGAVLLTGCEVVGINAAGNEIRSVATNQGVIETSTVICVAGTWSASVAAMAGVELPVTPLKRQVLITEPIPDLPPELPMTIDFSSTFYFHGEGQGLLLGMSDPDQPPGFDLTHTDTWLPALTTAMERRAPRILDAGVASGWAGLYEVTPDHNALIGESDGINRFLYATGFSGHGFLQGPAIGEIIRDLYLDRTPFVDITPLDVRRFHTTTHRHELNVV